MVETDPVLHKLFYRPDELAKMQDEPIRNIYTWIRVGKILAIRLGKCYEVRRLLRNSSISHSS